MRGLEVLILHAHVPGSVGMNACGKMWRPCVYVLEEAFGDQSDVMNGLDIRTWSYTKYWILEELLVFLGKRGSWVYV